MTGTHRACKWVDLVPLTCRSGRTAWRSADVPGYPRSILGARSAAGTANPVFPLRLGASAGSLPEALTVVRKSTRRPGRSD